MKSQKMILRFLRILTSFLLFSQLSIFASHAQNVSHADASPSPGPCVGLLDGENYAVLSDDGRSIRTCSYKTGKMGTNLFDVTTARGASLSRIESFQFDNAQKNMLLRTGNKYYTYDILRHRLHPLSDTASFQHRPVYSPNGRNIVFAIGRDLYLKKMDYDGVVMRMTRNGNPDSVANGVPDWIYEHQLHIGDMAAWAPDNRFLAFISLDDEGTSKQTLVQYPLNPESDNSSVPSLVSYFYPKAGGRLPRASVFVYDAFYKSVKRVPLPSDGVDYIVRVAWTSDPETFAVFGMNRNQNRVRMFLVNCKSLLWASLLDEQTSSWYDPIWVQKVLFLPDNRFVFPAVRDGYRQLCLYNRNGVMMKQLTSAHSDVTDVYGYDSIRQKVFFQAASPSALGRHVFSVDMKGTLSRLTEKDGVNRADFNPNYTYFVNEHSSLNNPVSYEVRSAQGRLVRQMECWTEGQSLPSSEKIPLREFVSFKSSLSDTLYAWLMKPEGFSPARKYPAVVLVGGVPDSQDVIDGVTGSELVEVASGLAADGYVVMCVDVHGCGARGESWRHGQHTRMGVQEASDLTEAANFLSSQKYISTGHIGVYGEGHGAYLALMGMSTGKASFRAGVAVSPLTDWRFSSAAYAERLMQRPQENGAYGMSSAIECAKRLHGSLLLIHGTADDGMHVENSYAYADCLISQNRPFEMLVYPNRSRISSDPVAKRHLHTSVLSFFNRNLK